MQGTEFDPAGVRLKITREDLAVLAAVARGGGTASTRATEDLRASGALTRRGVHPALEPVLAAVNRPVCEIHADRRAHGAPGRRAIGWVDPRVAALLTDRQHLEAGDPRWDLTAPHPTFLPAALAELFDLGPRGRPDTSGLARRSAVTVTALDRLLTLGQRATRDAVAETLPHRSEPAIAAVHQAVTRLRGRWRLEARWSAPGERTGWRSLDVIDSDPGLWVARREGRAGFRLVPATPTQIWRLLTTVLPTADEVSR